MGIYDRDYARADRGGGGATGRPPGMSWMSAWSCNTWIIVINIVVFVLGGMLTRAGVPVMERAATLENLHGATQVIVGDVFVDMNGVPAKSAQIHDADSKLRKLYGDPGHAFRTSGGTLPTGYGVMKIEDGGVFVISPILAYDTYRVMEPLEAYGHFSTAKGFAETRIGPSGRELVLNLQLWRLITFQFLHANFLHLLFNMFALFVFGGMVEQYLGKKRYAAFYLTCGIFGGLTYLLLNLMGETLGLRFPGVLVNDIHTPLVGASAGVFGVIIAAATIAPNAIIQLLFPPIPLKLKWFAYGYATLVVVNLLRGAPNAGGEAAHLGGIVAGWYFIRNSHHLRDFFDVFRRSDKNPKPKRRGGGGPNRSEVDRILAKVHAQGVHSLSEAEKRVLAKASESGES